MCRATCFHCDISLCRCFSYLLSSFYYCFSDVYRCLWTASYQKTSFARDHRFGCCHCYECVSSRTSDQHHFLLSLSAMPSACPCHGKKLCSQMKDLHLFFGPMYRVALPASLRSFDHS